ncbi:MAG: hypothetical protein P4L53_05260 [Candidatus Obscuribacterales bacterium]|nr:hypothetical protein [Candidatus Obscuribacterales bacterium]
MTINVATAITTGAFVNKGESVAVIGDRSSTYPLCQSIVEACRNVGKSVHVLMGDTDMARTSFDSVEVTSDLLFVWQLPTDSSDSVGLGTAWTAGKALARVLFQRAERGKSTLMASCERPRDWALHNRLGSDTFWTAASIGIGLLLSPDDPSQRPYFDRIRVPENDPNRALFDQYSVALMNWIIDPSVHSQFDRDSYRPDWHWVNCW